MLKINVEHSIIPAIDEEYWDKVICEVVKRYLSESGLKYHDTMPMMGKAWLKQ